MYSNSLTYLKILKLNGCKLAPQKLSELTNCDKIGGL